MPKIQYNKLVCDKIPQIIEHTGKACNIEILTTEQYVDKLNEKLLEEVMEYLESGAIEELADISEVIITILKHNNMCAGDLENIRLEKLKNRGGFEKRVLLKEVIEE